MSKKTKFNGQHQKNCFPFSLIKNNSPNGSFRWWYSVVQLMHANTYMSCYFICYLVLQIDFQIFQFNRKWSIFPRLLSLIMFFVLPSHAQKYQLFIKNIFSSDMMVLYHCSCCAPHTHIEMSSFFKILFLFHWLHYLLLFCSCAANTSLEIFFL